MAPPLININDIRLTFGGNDLFSDVSLAIGDRDRLCLVGRNGGGKSTLLKIIAGEIEADGGERFVQPGCKVAYLAQEPRFDKYSTVEEYVLDALDDHEQDYAYRAYMLLDAVKIDPQADPNTLSGGEGRRAAIARALIADPQVLLLDEPTNHLDLPTIEWLESEIKAFRGAVVVISHDRAFLNAVSNGVLWLDRGVMRRNDQNFALFDDWSEEVYRKEAEERAKLDKLIAQESVWAVQGISARRKRNQGRLRRLYDMRHERSQQEGRIGNVSLASDAGSTSGKVVIEATEIGKSWEDKHIISGFSTRILRGDKVGIIGPNGAGKTTLLKMLTGQIEPDEGTIKIGTNLTPTYFDQKRAALDDTKTLWDTLCDVGGDQIMVRGNPRHVVSYLRDFLFDEKQARSPVGALSGGERNRLLLAKQLAKPTNLLIMDEPTNDLDMDTLDLLQEMLSEYEGTLILVSHDRDFLDRVVTSSIVMEGNGIATEYPGGYSDYVHLRALSAKAEPENATSNTKPIKRGGGKGGNAAPAKPKSKAKLSYKDQRDYDTLPGQIEKLEAEITQIEADLADGTLFTSNPDAFQKKLDRMEAARAEAAKAEERWLEVEMMRDELGIE
ncbi:ATP-binding cassette domain-containing protein [Thalassospira sp. MCCC 1A01428]|jgi:ATP-binding cassette subfamily F protein uup|uniref:ATP-binding cassette domain-containing protein n=1 Tax=Thalassospira sp. MCCC 1A01428 TaxID=1470575 RepID=UPI000A1D7675|nr:ATP-binding cassette domain-containing protein [Thalassospira sp. MCCC 1A01428]OSQ45388.1 elongation factor 3 [Thalassospira sp. MCCC 1A01428]